MSVSSIGPFQAVSKRDFPDVKNITDEIMEKSKATSETKPDAEAEDSTQDQQNRGFIQILDYLARAEQKKRRQKSHKLMFDNGRQREKVIQKYHSLDHLEDDLKEKGKFVNTAI